MGVAITTAVREVATVIATPPVSPNTQSPVLPALVRFAIFLLVSIRWTMGVLWYLDKAYISKRPDVLTRQYFYDFFFLFINFLFFVPLALTITTPASAHARLSDWLNNLLVGSRQVSAFIWILALLLAYDFFWFLLKVLQRFLFRGEGPRRIHVFWAILNFATLLICAVIFLLYGWLQKDLQGAEVPILVVVLLASVIDLWGTVVEDSQLSQLISP